MHIEGYIPQITTVEFAERRMEKAYAHMQSLGEDPELGERAAVLFKERVIDLHVALFATDEEKAAYEQQAEDLRRYGRPVEPLKSPYL